MKFPDNKFLIIGFTTPDAWKDPKEEASAIDCLLDSGAIDIMHLRKPESGKEYYEALIKEISELSRGKLMTDRFPDLVKNQGLLGLHLKSGRIDDVAYNLKTDGFLLSRSCHHLADSEETDISTFDYTFLSPLFDSISKQGYKASPSLLNAAIEETTEVNKIIGLGGVTPDKFEKLYRLKFCGAALLGYLWQLNKTKEEIARELTNAREKLQ